MIEDQQQLLPKFLSPYFITRFVECRFVLILFLLFLPLWFFIWKVKGGSGVDHMLACIKLFIGFVTV